MANSGDFSIVKLTDAPELFGGSYPGEMRPLKDALGTQQVAVTWRRMPQHTGSKGSYGHRHREQEEVFYVLKGTLQFKLDDHIVDVPAGSLVRIAPAVVRGVWNDAPEDAELLIISNRIEADDSEQVEGFWPDDSGSAQS